MGKIIAIACAGLIVAGGATFGLYSYGAFCGGSDHGCCEIVDHDCCGHTTCPVESDAATSAALAVAGPAAALPTTSPVSAGVPSCCAPKTLAVKATCCEDDCCSTSGSGLNAVVGVSATATK